ncbi:lipopolysaccharide biosynthesis protein [Desulfosediminicola sp.]|uniref:lipopolysaccharide biosynthesis protein n=1 Tax=Desulfosediminicola sp. TaxID=2886825 RepID=UPI003AF205D8
MNAGHVRTKRIKKNVIGSFLVKSVSIVTGFILVPVTIEFVGTAEYGLWLTVASFLMWFGFFEIGLGNGLRNKLAIALANSDYDLGRRYISTTYALIAIIFGALLLVYHLITPLINWNAVLNSDLDASVLSSLTTIVFTFFLIRFIVKLIGVILVADQQPALSNMLGPIGNVIALLIILLVKGNVQNPLLFLSFLMSAMPVFVMILASIFFFGGKYKRLAPSIRYVDFKYSRELMSLGVQFFLLQCFTLVLFQSTNFLIIHFFGPEEVVSYNIAFKYFSVLNMVFTMMNAPYWSAYTEAWEKNDIQWIKNAINSKLKIFAVFIIGYSIMTIFSDAFFRIWIGSDRMENLHIGWSLKIALVCNFAVLSFGRIFILFTNGVGKLKVQILSLLLGALLFIPLVYFFVKILHMGIEGIVVASICANFYSLIIAPVQYMMIISGRADGVWNK